MGEWIRWQSYYDKKQNLDESWLLNLRIRIFKLLLLIGIIFLLIIVGRSIYTGGVAVIDLCNAVFFILLFGIVIWKPKTFKLLTWLGMLALFLNTFDGFRPDSTDVVIPSYILYPLLVLYGALLGDLWITLAAVLVIIVVYCYIWLTHSPLNKDDFYFLTNLCILVFASGVSSMTVWYHYHKMMKMFKRQSHDLRIELDNKLRLNALIFHDIVNPLSAIDGVVEMIEDKGKTEDEDMEIISKMSKKLVTIIETARGMESGFNIEFEEISIGALFQELKSLFFIKFNEKELKFELGEGESIKISSNLQLLCNSVLGNMISNAIKYSPRGEVITMKAENTGNNIRISITDEGKGFSHDMLKKIENGSEYFSEKGTEGELGNAYGMVIALLCLGKLNGQMEVKNQDDEGACVSILLPSK